VHVPRSVTLALRRRGIDVLTAQDCRLERAKDDEHLALAAREGRVLVTQDSDFLILSATGVSHAGIAYVRQGVPIGRMISGLLLIYNVLTADDMMNRVEYL
jgi:predicted nuclease of predicted toxin-antitoxin system